MPKCCLPESCPKMACQNASKHPKMPPPRSQNTKMPETSQSIPNDVLEDPKAPQNITVKYCPEISQSTPKCLNVPRRHFETLPSKYPPKGHCNAPKCLQMPQKTAVKCPKMPPRNITMMSSNAPKYPKTPPKPQKHPKIPS